MRATKKQEVQRELAWALYVCLGFRSLAERFVPERAGKGRLLGALESTIHQLYSGMERL